MFRPVTVQGPTDDMTELIGTLQEAGGTAMPVVGSEEMAPTEGELKLVLRLEPPLGDMNRCGGLPSG